MMQKYDFKKFSFVVFQLKDYFYIMYQYNYVIFLWLNSLILYIPVFWGLKELSGNVRHALFYR